MFEYRRVVRVDVRETAAGRTASGARVGDSEARIKELYPGRIREEPHHYSPEDGKYLFYVSADEADGEFGLVFETEKGDVTSFRSGYASAVELVEGCS